MLKKDQLSRKQRLKKFFGTTQGFILIGLISITGALAAGVLMSNVLTADFNVTDTKPFGGFCLN
ncbi:MAG: hypothetical protein JSV64_02380 [Candidatus Bathyarchaeota archaeon]|nr:MAG: hypothetical protein JSV64_02380 [Candidatus Bathyarchaeota archaeon]